MSKKIYPFSYGENSGVIFFIVVFISTIVTLSPVAILNYVSLDVAFSFVFISNAITALIVYVFYLNKTNSCRINIKTNSNTLKFIIPLFFVMISLQLFIYYSRHTEINDEPIQLGAIAIFIIIFVVPFYEEIIYRVCAFGLLSSIFTKNRIVPGVITSVFFA